MKLNFIGDRTAEGTTNICPPRQTSYPLALALTLFGFALHLLSITAQALVPEHQVNESGVHLTGVGPDNPIIYDNDWWFDVFDNNYLWAQTSLGNANLRGNIVTRDMWDWDKGYLYPMQKCVDDAGKALKLARDSGLKRKFPPAAKGVLV